MCRQKKTGQLRGQLLYRIFWSYVTGLYGKEKKTAPASEPVSAQHNKSNKEIAGPSEPKWQRVNKLKEKVEYKYLTAEEVLEQKQIRVRPDAG